LFKKEGEGTEGLSRAERKELSKFEGAWSYNFRDTTNYYVFKGNKMYFIFDGELNMETTFTTGFKVSEDNTILSIVRDYRLIKPRNQEAFVEKIFETDEMFYSFDKEGNLVLERDLVTKKVNIPDTELEKIFNLFEQRKEVPDFRDTVKRNNVVYRDDLNLNKLFKALSEDNFEQFASEKNIKNGTFKNGKIYFRDLHVYIGNENLKGKYRGNLKKGR